MTLAEQQASLIAALFEWPAGPAMEVAIKNIAGGALYTGARGIKAYRANGHAVAESALRAAYPVVRAMLSDDSFADLARALWHAHPPVQGDVARWGGALAAYMESSAQLADTPYVADVARCEWALHCSAIQAYVPLDIASLELLTTQDPADLALLLAPGLATVSSAWPVVSLLQAHREGSPTLQSVADLLRQQVREAAVVWRQGLRPNVRLALPGEVALLDALQEPQSLALALDRVPTLSFADWFPQAIQSGLVTGVCTVSSLRKSIRT
jgi:hypothetical protein